MAIQTAGYQPDVRLSVPQGPLLQADPNAANAGILDQFNLATDVEKAKAFKMMWEENQSLHDERVNAARQKLLDDAAKAEAAIKLRPLKTANEAFGDQTLALLNPGTRELAQGGQQLALGANRFDIQTQPTTLDTRRQVIENANAVQPSVNEANLNTAAVAAAKAGGQLDNVDLENQAARYQAENLAGTAKFANETQDMAQSLARQKLQSDLQNASTDIERARVLDQLKVLNAQSEIKLKAAQSVYYGGRNEAVASKGTRDYTSQELNNYTRQEDSLLKRPITIDGYTYPLSKYMDMRAQDSSMAADPTAERAISQLKHIQDLKDEILQESMEARAARKNGPAGAPAPVEIKYTPRPASGPGVIDPMTYDQAPRAKQVNTTSLTADELQAYQWAMTHPDDPRAPQILARLPGQ